MSIISKEKQAEAAAQGGVSGEGAYRDEIPTYDGKGKRQWIYPKKPKGRFYNRRTAFSLLLLFIMVIGPWVKINGNPLLLFNIPERKFALFGQLFWPQDLHLFAIAMITFFVCIILFTAVFGRVWCGWACPQTLLMEMVFRKIEYLIEGDAGKQKRLDKQAWNFEKVTKKALKHSIFFGLSFVIGNLLLAYIIGGDALIALITDNPFDHTKGLSAMILFTLVFYGIFARFREQACTFVCPYGRLQSMMLDDQSIVVAYDFKRGDQRAPWNKKQEPDARRALGQGDCIDCGQCVRVCPTGIDIRNGTQMECVNCTACIDACDDVMDKISLPRGLVRYTSRQQIDAGSRWKVTPRIAGYLVVLCLLGGLLGYLLFTRSDVETSFLRAPGTLYQELPDGGFSNLYQVRVVNKTNRAMDISLEVLEPAEATLTLAGGVLQLPAGGDAQSMVILELPGAQARGSQEVVIGVSRGPEELDRVKSRFTGPM